MDTQMQGGRCPLTPRPGCVTLERIARMVCRKGGVPGVNVISVMISVRIVTHQANVVRADSDSQCSEHRQCAERGQRW